MQTPPLGSVLVLVSCHRCRRLHEAPLTDASNSTCPACAGAANPPALGHPRPRLR